VRFQYAPAGTTAWTDACTDATAPYSCSWATTGAADALYDMRALATDRAGNTTASATAASRRVDNSGPTVSVTDPGSPLRGSVTVAASASDPAGVGSVTIQYRTSSSGAWTDICTDNAAPYSCAWATSGLTDGVYDLRANATDTVSHSSTSAVVSARRVDNTAPAALDVQGSNGGTAGTVDAGDTLTFSYNEPMAPGSILAGWTGFSTPVTVKLVNHGAQDTLSVWDAAGTTELALTSAAQDLQLNQGWVSSSPVLNATMAQSGYDVIVTFGTLRSGSVGTGVKRNSPMQWTPSTAATDLAGNPCATTVATESGAVDVDF
jgi:hypothetical protein